MYIFFLLYFLCSFPVFISFFYSFFNFFFLVPFSSYFPFIFLPFLFFQLVFLKFSPFFSSFPLYLFLKISHSFSFLCQHTKHKSFITGTLPPSPQHTLPNSVPTFEALAFVFLVFLIHASLSTLDNAATQTYLSNVCCSLQQHTTHAYTVVIYVMQSPPALSNTNII